MSMLLQANLKSAQSNLNSSMQSAKAAEFTVKSSEASLKELQDLTFQDIHLCSIFRDYL